MNTNNSTSSVVPIAGGKYKAARPTPEAWAAVLTPTAEKLIRRAALSVFGMNASDFDDVRVELQLWLAAWVTLNPTKSLDKSAPMLDLRRVAITAQRHLHAAATGEADKAIYESEVSSAGIEFDEKVTSILDAPSKTARRTFGIEVRDIDIDLIELAEGRATLAQLAELNGLRLSAMTMRIKRRTDALVVEHGSLRDALLAIDSRELVAA